ncbi:MAG: ATP12 family protein [Pseudomonadota bacterium]
MSFKKRFWSDVTIEESRDGFEIALDGRHVKTPAKSSLALPNRALAELVAGEWRAQETDVQPETMPATRMGNSVIDKVHHNHAAIVDMLADYGGTDLVCYRATGPYELIARQASAWDPILAWVQDTYGPLNITEGVMHIDQPKTTLKNLKLPVAALNPWQLAGFHDLVTISGSLVLALAVGSNHLETEAAWNASRVDEIWQIDQWGADEQAEANAGHKRDAFLFAEKFYRLASD